MPTPGNDPALSRQRVIERGLRAVDHYADSGLRDLAATGHPVYDPAAEMAVAIFLLITELDPDRQYDRGYRESGQALSPLPAETPSPGTVTMTDARDPGAWRPRFPRRPGTRLAGGPDGR
jgi:hypothetical protein